MREWDSMSVYIRGMELSDAEAMLELRLRNREFMAPYEPVREEAFYTLEAQEKMLRQALAEQEMGLTYPMGIFLRETDELIGRVNLSCVVRGAWQNANIGYYVDQTRNGRGYCTEAVRLALRFAFKEAALHRVQAAIMPWNERSIRVVEKVGMRKEGLALRYLKINGKWEDHVIYAITREEWEEEGASEELEIV
jgi:ribosomal-protein-alanine N-acetyltransferase